MKKIIVPVDFSENSLQALKSAIEVAKRVEGSITLLHVIKIKSFPLFGGEDKPERDTASIENNFTDLINHIHHDGVSIDYVIHTGKVSSEIIKFSDEQDAYLIIMGTHGSSGFEEFWAGSNAYRVVAGASCPVITMRGTNAKVDFKKIVLPIDLSPGTREKVPFTMELAKVFGAEIFVIGTDMGDTEEFVNRLKIYVNQTVGFIQNEGVKVSSEIITGDNVTNMTIEYAQKIGADLISIMTEQETALVNTFIGPYAQQMVNHSSLPVLSMQRTHDAVTGASF
jgi:nucleotide-binding universal stress UspA family protein